MFKEDLMSCSFSPVLFQAANQNRIDSDQESVDNYFSENSEDKIQDQTRMVT